MDLHAQFILGKGSHESFIPVSQRRLSPYVHAAPAWLPLGMG